jgi:hypothetical protein
MYLGKKDISQLYHIKIWLVSVDVKPMKEILMVSKQVV